MLIKLDNGDYINLKDIRATRCAASIKLVTGSECGNKVILDMGNGSTQIIYKNSFADCLAYAHAKALFSFSEMR